MSIWPTLNFDVITAVSTMVEAVDNVEHKETLLSGLSRFTPYMQYKMAKQYLAKVQTHNDVWYKDEPINPSDEANAWFYDVLKNAEYRIDVSFFKLSKPAKSALKKVHNNNHHNYIVRDLISSNRKASIQASFVRRTAETLSFTEKQREVLAQKKMQPSSDETAFLQKLVGGDVTSSVRSIIDAIDDTAEKEFVYKCLSKVPKPLQMRVAKRFIDKYEPSIKRYKQKRNENTEQYTDRIASQSAELYQFDGTTKKPTNTNIFESIRDHRNANQWLLRTIKTLKPRLTILKQITDSMPLPWHILANVDKTKKHAEVLAREVTEILNDLGIENPSWGALDKFDVISQYAENFGVTLFAAEKGIYLTEPDAEVSLLKAQCYKWWGRKLKNIRRRYLEHLEIATGEVGKDLFAKYDKKKGTKTVRKGINAYCSHQALNEYKADRERGKRYLESLELVNEQSDVISLMKAVEAGIANPENMRNELMLRIRETEELADEMGYVGGFYNITAPSRFHANSPKWDGSTPKDASNYLNKLYSQARAKLDRLEIPYFGVRVAEPHADGCTHWHMLLWMPARYYDKVNHLLRRYFTRDDREVFFQRFKNRKHYRRKYKHNRKIWGLNKSKGIYTKAPVKNYFPSSPRYTAMKMEPAKIGKDGKRIGGAAAYIAKYVSKNIDGFGLANEYDAETGEKFTQSALVNPVKAWASTWGIRQFQFQKSPAITIWRELRRVREAIQGNEELEQIRKAADEGSFKTFVTLMGGFGIGRNARFKPVYEYTEYGNQYAECVKRIKGIEDLHEPCTLITRVHTWQKQIIGTAAANDNTAVNGGQDANNVGAADLSWSSGNNCTPCTVGDRDELLLDMIGFTKKQIAKVKKDLIAGKRIRRNGQIYLIRDGNLLVLDEEKQLIEYRKESVEYIAHTEMQKQQKLAGQQESAPVKTSLYDFAPEHIDQLNDGGTVVIGSRVYHMQGRELHSFEKFDFSKQRPALRTTPTEKHYQYARELYDLATSYAKVDGRTMPSNTQFKKGHADVIGDLDLARLVLAGEATAVSDNDWWALDLMA